MTEFQQSTRKPTDATLGEFAQYQELLTEAGREAIALDDALAVAEQREAARDARRRTTAADPDRVGRGRQ
jgi:hypothetical protein